MRIDVLDVAEEKGSSKRFWSQPIALYYATKRVPVEDMMFLNSPADQLPVGSYVIDVEKCIEPDSSNRNKPMLWIRPKSLTPYKPAVGSVRTMDAGASANLDAKKVG